MTMFISSSGPCFDRAWPEERLLTHLLRSAATASPEAFKSLQGDHPVDIYQSQHAYEIRTDAPGLSQDDIVVEVHEDVLRIAASPSKPPTSSAIPNSRAASATAASATAASNGISEERPPSPTAPSSPPAPNTTSSSSWKAVRRERSQPSAWCRAFLLPETADAEHISVQLDKGLLTVHVPKCPPPPKTQPRRIAVHTQLTQ